MRMYNPPHPGEILYELWLQPLNLTITQTAQKLNVTRKPFLRWSMVNRVSAL